MGIGFGPSLCQERRTGAVHWVLPLIAACGSPSLLAEAGGPYIFKAGFSCCPNEFFHVAVNPSDATLLKTARIQLLLERGDRLHVIGTVKDGTGVGAEANSPWRWHFKTDSWGLWDHCHKDDDCSVASKSEKLPCDGIASFVEKDVRGWINDVGKFCPWSSFLESCLNCGDLPPLSFGPTVGDYLITFSRDATKQHRQRVEDAIVRQAGGKVAQR